MSENKIDWEREFWAEQAKRLKFEAHFDAAEAQLAQARLTLEQATQALAVIHSWVSPGSPEYPGAWLNAESISRHALSAARAFLGES